MLVLCCILVFWLRVELLLLEIYKREIYIVIIILRRNSTARPVNTVCFCVIHNIYSSEGKFKVLVLVAMQFNLFRCLVVVAWSGKIGILTAGKFIEGEYLKS